MVREFEPHIGLSAVKTEAALDPLSPSLSIPPQTCAISLSLSKINIKKKFFLKKEQDMLSFSYILKYSKYLRLNILSSFNQY